jgi:hypothetical protein
MVGGFVLNDYQVKVNSFFDNYKEAIYTLHYNQFKQESIYDKSCLQFKVIDYYSALYLVSLIYQDILDNPLYDWEYFKVKYDLVNINKCYACKGIKLTDIFKLFGYPFKNTQIGIELMEIESTFIVEPSVINDNLLQVNIFDYINATTNYSCNTTIQ